MPIKKEAGESKNDFVSRCISYEIDNGMSQDQAVAVCINKWENFSIKEISSIRNDKYKEDKWIVKFFEKNDIGMSIKEMGLTLEDFYNPKYQQRLTDDDLEMLPMESFSKLRELGELNEEKLFAEEDYITIYKYVSETYGPKGYGPNSRPFCVELMKQKDKVFTMSDIVALNNAPGKANRAGGGGYSVFKYRGGNNCLHKWVRYTYDAVKKELVEPTFIQPAQPALR